MTPETDPFSQEKLNKIFSASPNKPNQLKSRENNRLEFKESFNFGGIGRYIRTAAGFANAKGGYIVFGVENSPHTLVGLKTDAFRKVDPERITGFLNEHFDPAIDAEFHIHELDGKSFGLIYFHESKNKPVVCKKSADDGHVLKDGEIYFRYNGRTQAILHAELKELIDERRRHEQLLWLRHLKEIARIGVSDAALLNLRTGTLKGTGASMVIDESLLPQLAFIREGEFSETKGKPTLKLIGSVEAVGKITRRINAPGRVLKTKGIRASDIITSFLRDERVTNPKEYLSQIAWEPSAFLPAYYYIGLARLSLEQAVKLIDDQQSTTQAKAKLLQRLKSSESLGLKMPAQLNSVGSRKTQVRAKLMSKEAKGNMTEIELCDSLDMIRTIGKAELSMPYLRSFLLEVYTRNFAKQNQKINDKIRRAICYIDLVCYRK